MIIKLEDYFMGRDKTHKNELDEEIQKNAVILLEKVNALLDELKIKSAKVSSGWRPPTINAGIGNAAKKSLHQTGKAVDILDSNQQTLGNLIKSKPELLKKYGLWMEDLDSTKGQYTNWVHLDFGDRKDRDIRIFHP